jgi:nitroreductase
MSSKSDIFQEMQGLKRPGTPAANEEVPSPAFAQENLAAFQKVLRARRSIRIYTGERIPEASMREILAEATLAPSSSNLQSYQLYWIKDSKKKAEVAAACLGQPAATTAGELVVVVARHDQWRKNLSELLSVMKQNGELPPPVKFYYETLIPKVMANDPLGLMNALRRVIYFFTGLKRPTVRGPVNQGDHRIFGHTQAALAAQTLMLSFTAHGYDSCPMGGMDAKRIARLLDLPRSAEVAMVISAGIRKPEGLYGPRYRLPIGSLIKEV